MPLDALARYSWIVGQAARRDRRLAYLWFGPPEIAWDTDDTSSSASDSSTVASADENGGSSDVPLRRRAWHFHPRGVPGLDVWHRWSTSLIARAGPSLASSNAERRAVIPSRCSEGGSVASTSSTSLRPSSIVPPSARVMAWRAVPGCARAARPRRGAPQPDSQAKAFLGALQQPLPFRGLGHRLGAQVAELGRAERLAEGDDLQQRPRLGSELEANSLADTRRAGEHQHCFRLIRRFRRVRSSSSRPTSCHSARIS